MVAFDANLFVYILENNAEFFEPAARALKKALNSRGSVCVATLALTEILSGTNNKNALDLILKTPGVVVYDLTQDIATIAGNLRFENKSLHTPDAIHLATAISCGASQFITNDPRLPRIAVKSCKIVPLLEYVR